MKGQKLFVRVASSTDYPAIAGLYDDQKLTPVRGEFEVLGKLVGDVVAHAALDFPSPDVAEIASIRVATPLRGKRVGTVLLRELVVLLREKGIARLLTRRTGEATDLFFSRNGFRDSGEFLTLDLLF